MPPFRTASLVLTLALPGQRIAAASSATQGAEATDVAANALANGLPFGERDANQGGESESEGDE